MIPFKILQRREVLMPSGVLLERDFRCLYDAASHSDVAAIEKLDLEEEDKIRKPIKMLEKKEFGVSPGKEPEIKQSAKRGLSKVMGVAITVLRQTNLCKHNI